MKWEKTGRRQWHLQNEGGFSLWLRYDNLAQCYLFGCASIGIGVHHLKADNAADAKAEALQIVTERLESIIEQLKSV